MKKLFEHFSFIRDFAERTRGTAGTEFAIAAPVVLFVVIIMADFGFAIGQQINLDQSVRAGAEFVMGGVDNTSDVEEIVAAAATGYSNSDAQDAGESRPTVSVTEVCRCPGSGVEVSCAASCSGDDPSHFYSIVASETYDPIFISVLNLRAAVQVQVQ